MSFGFLMPSVFLYIHRRENSVSYFQIKLITIIVSSLCLVTTLPFICLATRSFRSPAMRYHEYERFNRLYFQKYLQTYLWPELQHHYLAHTHRDSSADLFIHWFSRLNVYFCFFYELIWMLQLMLFHVHTFLNINV